MTRLCIHTLKQRMEILRKQDVTQMAPPLVQRLRKIEITLKFHRYGQGHTRKKLHVDTMEEKCTMQLVKQVIMMKE